MLKLYFVLVVIYFLFGYFFLFLFFALCSLLTLYRELYSE